MKTFYKITIKFHYTDKCSVDVVVLVRDSFTYEQADEVANVHMTRGQKIFKVPATYKIETKSYKRVPKKYGCF